MEDAVFALEIIHVAFCNPEFDAMPVSGVEDR